MMIHMNDRPDRHTVIVAVPVEAVPELEREGLADSLPVLRGTTLDVVATVGMDAAALVTLFQAPESIRAFAEWLRGRSTRSGDSIEVNVKRGNRRLHLTVEGDMDIDVVADFLINAFADHSPQT